MDPLPVQVTPEVNVEPANTAALLRVSVMTMTNSRVINPKVHFCLISCIEYVTFILYIMMCV